MKEHCLCIKGELSFSQDSYVWVEVTGIITFHKISLIKNLIFTNWLTQKNLTTLKISVCS